MAEFASRGVGNAALTTGIIGTAAAALNGSLGNILGGVMNNGNAVNTALLAAMAANNGTLGGCHCNGGCSENQLVNRYELAQEWFSSLQRFPGTPKKSSGLKITPLLLASP